LVKLLNDAIHPSMAPLTPDVSLTGRFLDVNIRANARPNHFALPHR